MKKVLAVLMAGVLLNGLADAVSLVDARAQIDDLIANPTKMTETVKQMSAEDQKAFLADVNKAIAGMPGSSESRAATALNVNKAILRGAQKGNLTVLLAEVFATVTPEALTLINESFAADLFNRAANPSVTMTDEQYTQVATETLKQIVERNATADNAGPRDVFAALMLVRASNGTPADLSATLAALLPEDVRELAKTEWMPAALADEKSYEGLLAACDAGSQPDPVVCLRVAGPQMLEALLTQLGAGGVDATMTTVGMPTVSNFNAENDNAIYRVPFTYNTSALRKGLGAKTPAERNVGDGPTTYVDDDGNVRVLPGGVPVDEDGRPIGPDGREIPMGYDGQD